MIQYKAQYEIKEEIAKLIGDLEALTTTDFNMKNEGDWNPTDEADKIRIKIKELEKQLI